MSLERTIKNEFGPAFQVTAQPEVGNRDEVTLWYEECENQEGFCTGRKLTPNQARELAMALEEAAQAAQPASHSQGDDE